MNRRFTMNNIYLEKIASLTGAAMGAAAAVGRVAYKGVKAVANQAHLATGGAYMNHAQNVLGIKDPQKLARMGGSKKQLWQATKKNLGANPNKRQVRDAFKTFKDDTLPGLKNTQTDARIALGATAAAGAYAGSKIKSKLDEPKVTTYNY